MAHAQTASSPQAGEVLSKAVVRAANSLRLNQAAVADILGVSTATASRLHAGGYTLNPQRKKEWELSLLFVRLFRSLDAILGRGEQAAQWLAGENLALNGRPAELVRTAEGLIRVIHYLDAYRSRI